MSDKLIWSNTMTQDYLTDLPEESLRAELVDYGYEEDMLATLDYQGLRQLVYDDDYMWQADSEDFEYNVAPEIEKQTRDGIVLLSGSVGRWGGNRGAGIACNVEDLISGDMCRDCDKLAIYDNDGNLVWEASHHDGAHVMGLYAFPDGEQLREFVMTCMGDAIDDEVSYTDDPEAAVMSVIDNVEDVNYINSYCDFSKVPEVCEPIKATSTAVKESCEEAPIEEAKSKNPENLAMELQTIKDDYEDFGPDGFYAVPFKRFEKEFPEFTKSCIMSYLKELEILEPDELHDPEIFDEYWQTGELIIPEDWPILIDGANRLSTDRAEKGYQWITLLKKYRQPLDVEDESLTECLLDEFLEDDVVVDFPTQDNVLIINEPEVEAVPVAASEWGSAPEPNCTIETATAVMAAYQNANKWLDIVKEIVYTNLGCVFFSSYIHELAHTMPGRFDRFGDILHTVNMRIPYPETPYIPTEPTNIDEVFSSVFMCLDNIKSALNSFIKCTDEQYHGMACAAETLLNNIECEYPTLFKMQQEWNNCQGDMATFDKYIGQYIEHKSELLA